MDMNTETTATKPAGFPKVKGQEYNNKIIEFAHANTNAAFDFVQKLSSVKSPSAFLELSTKHARKQFGPHFEPTFPDRHCFEPSPHGSAVSHARLEPLPFGYTWPRAAGWQGRLGKVRYAPPRPGSQGTWRRHGADTSAFHNRDPDDNSLISMVGAHGLEP